MSEKAEKAEKKARKKLEKKLAKAEAKREASSSGSGGKLRRSASSVFGGGGSPSIRADSSRSSDDDSSGGESSDGGGSRRSKTVAARAFSSVSSRQLRGSPSVAAAPQSGSGSSKLPRSSSFRRRDNALSVSSTELGGAPSSSTPQSKKTLQTAAASDSASQSGGGGGGSQDAKNTKKLRRLSASFALRKGRIVGGSARSGSREDTAESGDSDVEGSDDGSMTGSMVSSEAMLAKYLPFLATPALAVTTAASDSAPAESATPGFRETSPRGQAPGAAALGAQPMSASTEIVGKTRSVSLAAPVMRQDEDSKDEPVIERQDAILSLIESESLGPTFRSVFEQNKEKEFIRTLDVFIRSKRKEIENVCNFHYQEFIHSVDELLALRSEIVQLKDDILQLNGQIQAAGASLLEKTQGLISLRATHANINVAIEELSRCMSVFHLCEEANKQIKDGQFYKALRALSEIEHQALPQLPQYEFVKYLEKKIPALKETIKKYVTDEFNEWLVSVREHAQEVGSMAMMQTASLIKEEQRIKKELKDVVMITVNAQVNNGQTTTATADDSAGKKKKRKNGADTSGEKQISPRGKATIPESDSGQEMGVFQRVGVTFTPVYKCLHIYEALSSLGEFEAYYQYTRQLQAHLVQQGPTGPAFLANRRTYESYFHQIIGFFVIEAHVLHTTQSLISHSTIKSWWDNAAHRIRGTLLDQVNLHCRDVVILQQLRDFVFLFSRTISSYGYEVTVLQDFFKAMRDKYIDLATQSYREEFFTVLERETFQPLVIGNEDEYKLMIIDNNLEKIYPHQFRLPMKFPFCAFVPNCVSIVKHFIQTYYEFSKDLFADTDEFVKKGTELLLKVMCNTISKQITESSKSNVLSLVQLSLSLPYMKSCCDVFESYISSFKYLGAESSSLSRSMFDTLRDNAERRMFEVIDNKIDSLFDNININWALQAPSREPRDWVDELFLYLQTTLTVFDPLRKELKDEITLEALNRLASNLRNLVYNNDAKRINTAAIQSLDVDLRYAENMMKQWSFSSLQSTIRELRQMVSLLLSENVVEFLDERVRRAKYPDLSDIPKIVGLLQKFETESTLGRFSVALGGKASKRQNIETLIRSLSSEGRVGSGVSSPSMRITSKE